MKISMYRVPDSGLTMMPAGKIIGVDYCSVFVLAEEDAPLIARDIRSFGVG